MKNYSDTIENRTRDLLACSPVPQPTTPSRTPFAIVPNSFPGPEHGCYNCGSPQYLQAKSDIVPHIKTRLLPETTLCNVLFTDDLWLCCTVKGTAIPVRDCYRTIGFQEVEAPKFRDNRHTKMVMLSALHTGRLYPQGNITGTYFCLRFSRHQGHSAAGKIMLMAPFGIEPATFRLVAHRVPPFASQFSNILTLNLLAPTTVGARINP